MKNKNKILDLVGISLPDSITFFGEKGETEVDTKYLKIPPRYIKEKSFSLYRLCRKVPIIRGYAFVFDILFQLLKNKWSIFIILFLIGIKDEHSSSQP